MVSKPVIYRGLLHQAAFRYESNNVSKPVIYRGLLHTVKNHQNARSVSKPVIYGGLLHTSVLRVGRSTSLKTCHIQRVIAPMFEA